MEKHFDDIIENISHSTYEVGKKIGSCVKQKEIINDKQELESHVTEFVTNTLLETNENIASFLYLITSTFDHVLKKYCKKKSLEQTDIYFAYKGGNMLRMLVNGSLANFPKFVSTLIEEKYNKYFKKSDADFSIYINPELHNFYEIYNEIF